jgi:hypothetical protein
MPSRYTERGMTAERVRAKLSERRPAAATPGRRTAACTSSSATHGFSSTCSSSCGGLAVPPIRLTHTCLRFTFGMRRVRSRRGGRWSSIWRSGEGGSRTQKWRRTSASRTMTDPLIAMSRRRSETGRRELLPSGAVGSLPQEDRERERSPFGRGRPFGFVASLVVARLLSRKRWREALSRPKKSLTPAGAGARA